MKRNFKYSLLFLVNLLPYLFVFIASLYRPTDPDLGWHLKYGEYFFQNHHILKDNIFSTMMPGFHWANGSWGTDILSYIIFKHCGFLGLTIVSAIIVTVTFFFFAKASNLSFLEKSIFFPIIIYLVAPINNVSFRGQQISLLFLGILFFILSRYTSFSKVILFVPFLFIVWVNIHEESFLGLALFFLWTVSIIGKNFLDKFQSKSKVVWKKETIFFFVIFLISFFVTFINPFGWNIHLVALSHLQDPLLKKISEYVPFSMFGKLWWENIFMLIIIFLGIVYLFYKKTFLHFFPTIIFSIVLIIFSFNVRRYAWPAYYFSLPLLHIFGNTLNKYVKKYAAPIAICTVIISIVFVVYEKIPFNQFATMSWDTYCQLQTAPCSPASAKYLQKNKLTNIFSYYDWGGWLIWNYPDVKPSIDGRMHLWRDVNGYSATEEYDSYQSLQKNIYNSHYDTIYIPINRTPFQYSLSTQQNKWKLVYEDELVGIVVRVKK